MNDWYKNGKLPPIGEVCQYHHYKFAWKPIQVIGRHLDKIVFAIWDLPEDYADYVYMACNLHNLFRPLRTETDKLVEEAGEIVPQYTNEVAESVRKYTIETLIENGYRKIKPMTEEEFVTDIQRFIKSFKARTDWAEILYRSGCRFIEQGE